jgi:hypothetical protein
MASMPGIVIKVGVDAAKGIKNLDNVGKALARASTRADKARIAWKQIGVGVAAAGAALTAVAADSVQAFIDDQKEAATLGKVMENMNFGDRTAEVTAFIDQLQFVANVSESVLRPAFSTLVRATGDVTTAQSQLQLALDISATTGLDVASVADSLGKAWAGNRRGLLTLKSGLDRTYLSSASMVDITGKLQTVFGGASDTAAGTLSGGIAGVNLGLEELKESFGAGLVGNVDTVNGRLQETEQRLRNLQPAAEQAGGVISDVLGGAADQGARVLSTFNRDDAGFATMFQRFAEWASMGAIPDNLFGNVTTGLDGTASAAGGVTQEFDDMARRAATAAAAHRDLNTALGETPAAAATAVSALMNVGDAYTALNYFGGTPTSGYDREATTMAILGFQKNARDRAAAARARARAKKKEARLDAVRQAASFADTIARAASRTGAQVATAKVELSRRSCA